MKKVLTLVIAAIFSTISFQSFSTNDSDNANETKVKQTVISQITYPDFAKEQKIEGDVLVSFKVSKDGKVVVLSSNSSEVKLQNYVVEKMKTVNLSSVDVEEGFVYNVKFSFQLL